MSSGPSWVPERLAHLRRDRRGLPVPFVNAWGDPDDASLYRVAPDTTVRADAVYRDDEGEQVPDFLRQNPQRQRWCMGHGWCQVCARPVSWSRRMLVLSAISLTVIEAGGQEWLACAEPWLCERDAVLAVERCPGLIRRNVADDLVLWKPERHTTALASSVGCIDAPGLEWTRQRPVVMWTKILLKPSALPAGMTLQVRDARDAALAEALGGGGRPTLD